MSCKTCLNRQLSPEENPVTPRLVKDGKTSEKANSANLLEIIHKAVTFTPTSIDKDNVELNRAISDGYLIQEFVRTETGIVYVLAKVNCLKTKTNDLKKSEVSNDLINCYQNFCQGAKQ